MNNINSVRHFHATKGNSLYQFLDANFDMYGYFERFLWRFAASYAYINFVWLFSSGFCPSGQTLTTQKVTFPIKDKREMYFIFYLLQQLPITKHVLLFVSVHTCIMLYFRCSWKWCTFWQKNEALTFFPICLIFLWHSKYHLGNKLSMNQKNSTIKCYLQFNNLIFFFGGGG